MTLATPLTELLDIRHPILLAPMDKVSGGALAAAVSAAGGLGLLGGGYGNADWLHAQARVAGNQRVGVGFITWSLAEQPALLDQALERRPAAVMLSFGDPAPFVAPIKQSGAVLICQVHSVHDAREAARAGADVIVAQGSEAGGHGRDRGTFSLVPAVVDAVAPLPVVAAGGVADGRGLAAALMLGASGVLVGTRFWASAEALGPEAAKARMVAAAGDDTVRGKVFDIARDARWPARFTGRCLANAFTARWHGREAELLDNAERERARYAEAAAAGDFDTAAVIAGEAVDLVHDLPPAGELVARIAAQAEALLAG